MSEPPRIHLVATLKNEGPYLVEWIAHYKAIGVADFTLFSNDCTDGSNLMLDRLDAMGEIRHFDNPVGPRMDPQRRAYSRAGKMAEVRAADWVLVVDADEFVHVETGDGTLPALIDSCGPADAISLGWRLMGSDGARRWIDGPVTQRFLRGGSVEPPENGMVPGFKTLFRPAVFDYFGVHRPKFDKKIRTHLPRIVWRNGSGRDIAEAVTAKGWRFGPDTAGYAFGWVNHYAVKSREEFLLKRLRGSANTKTHDRIDLSYWQTFDLNSMAPPPIQTEKTQAETARLMADAELATLRRACLVTARRVLEGQLAEGEHRAFLIGAPDAADRTQRTDGPAAAPPVAAAAQDESRTQDGGYGTGHRFVLFATVKNEAPYLLEWIAWHRLIGVDHFVIFSNDCTDGTDAMLDRLAEMGLVEHIRNEGADDDPPHYRALRRAPRLESIRTAEWVIHVDADEFLDLTAGDGSLADFVAACDPAGKAHAISLMWRYMGSHGQSTPSGAPLTQRFRRGSRIVLPETPTASHFKTIFRPQFFTAFGIHRPKVLDPDNRLVWRNASGDDLSDHLGGKHANEVRLHIPPDRAGFRHGAIRHYAVKSRAEYLCKQTRGSATHSHERLTDGYFIARNINTLALKPLGEARLPTAIAELASDPALAALQAAARTDLDARVAELNHDPAARHFIETGYLPHGSGRPPGRLLCIATHHKSGTMWMRYTARQIADTQGVEMRQMSRLRHLERISPDAPQILVHWDGEFPRPIYDMPEARILHVIRDPRDILVSGMRYHRRAPRAREGFLAETRPEWHGMTYQAYLNSLPDDTTRLMFEMAHKHATTVEEMLAWAYGRTDTIELRYEDLMQDTEGRVFRAALERADIAWLDIDGALAAYRRHALWGGNADPANRDTRVALHITSGAPQQWPALLPREVAEPYAASFGDALRVLGYAEDSSWVSRCQPAAEIASAPAAE